MRDKARFRKGDFIVDALVKELQQGRPIDGIVLDQLQKAPGESFTEDEALAVFLEIQELPFFHVNATSGVENIPEKVMLLTGKAREASTQKKSLDELELHALNRGLIVAAYPKGTAGSQSLKTLVVDDSAVMRKIIISALQTIGMANFIFQEASNGQEALTSCLSSDVDLVFLDWNMPQMNGIEFVVLVRKEIDNRAMPIVLVTSEQTPARVQEAFNKGADAYITKPFDPALVRARLAPVMKGLEESAGRIKAAAEPKQGFFGGFSRKS
ncbi:MAG: response regulator [Elusimicrobiota bacterium]